MNVDKFTIISYDKIVCYDNGILELILDELNDFTLSQEENKSEIIGKNGRTISYLKKNKKVTGKGTNGLLSSGALSVMVGSEFESGEYDVMYKDTITVTSNKGITSNDAIGAIGNEIGNIYINSGKRLTQTSNSPSTGEFSYVPETREIIFYPGDIADGTEVIAFYYIKTIGNKITNSSNKYSKVLQAFIDVTCQDACDNLFHGQFIIQMADFSGTFDFSGGSEPTTLGFEFTSLPSLCTRKTGLWDFIVYKENTNEVILDSNGALIFPVNTLPSLGDDGILVFPSNVKPMLDDNGILII